MEILQKISQLFVLATLISYCSDGGGGGSTAPATATAAPPATEETPDEEAPADPGASVDPAGTPEPAPAPAPNTDPVEVIGATGSIAISAVGEAGGLIKPAAGQTALAGSQLNLAAGSLGSTGGKKVRVSVEQAYDLHKQGVATELNLDSGQITPKSASMMVLPNIAATMVQPGQLSLSIPDAQPSLSLTSTASNTDYAILYKTISAEGYQVGVLAPSAFSIVEGKAVFEISQWGAYQVVANPGITESSTASSAFAAIFNQNLEKAIDSDGLGTAQVALKPVERTFLLPYNAQIRHFINASNASAFELNGKCTEEGGAVLLSGAVSAELVCTEYRWSLTHDFTQTPDGELRLEITHNGEGERTDTETFAIVKDTVVPDASLDSTNLTGNSGEIFLTASAIANYKFEQTSGDGNVILTPKFSDISNGGIFEYATANAGTYKFNLEFYDLAENSKSFALTLTVTETIEVTPPPEITTFIASTTPGSDTVSFQVQTQETDNFGGFLVVRREGSAVTWKPTDGQSYQVNTSLDSNHSVAAVLNDIYASGSDSGLNIGSTYHYEVFSYNLDLEYSEGASDSASVVSLSNDRVAQFGGNIEDIELHTLNSRNHLLTAWGRGGFAIYDIHDTPTAPVLKGKIDINADASETPKIVASGNYAYISVKYFGLAVIDISDPTNPTSVATYNPDYNASFPNNGSVFLDMQVLGNNLYIVSNSFGSNDGLIILDISDPTNPTQAGYKEYYYGKALVVEGNYAYVSVSNGSNELGLQVYDISDPSSITSAGDSADADSTGSTYTDLIKDGNYIYAAGASGSKMVRRFDVSNLSGITDELMYSTLNSYELVKGTNVIAMAKSVGAGSSLTLYDHTNNGWYPNSSSGSWQASDVSAHSMTTSLVSAVEILNDTYAYFAANSNGVGVVHIEDSDTGTVGYQIPDISGSLDGQVFTLTHAQHISIDASADLAFVSDVDAGVALLDITDNTNPSIVGVYTLGSGQPLSTVVNGNELFVATSNDGIHKVDITSSSSPTLDSKNNTFTDQTITKMVLSGSQLFVSVEGSSSGSATSETGIFVFNTADLSVVVDSVTNINAETIDYDASNEVVAIGRPDGNIDFYSFVGDTLTSKGSVDLGDSIYDLVLNSSANKAYVGVNQVDGFSNDQIFTVVDYNDLDNPAKQGEEALIQATSNVIKGMLFANDRVYVPAGGSEQGVYIIDPSDPTNPQIPTVLKASYSAHGVVLDGSRALIADYWEGLSIHNLP